MNSHLAHDERAYLAAQADGRRRKLQAVAGEDEAGDGRHLFGRPCAGDQRGRISRRLRGPQFVLSRVSLMDSGDSCQLARRASYRVDATMYHDLYPRHKECRQMDMGLKNKTALVTGSTRGIGKAIALELAREGVHVLINGRNIAFRTDASIRCDQIHAVVIIQELVQADPRR